MFGEAFKDLMKWEGEQYTNDPDDPGGETKYGISKKAFPNINIKELTLDQAEKIYYSKYWKIAKCADILEACGYELAQKVFNIAVNIGPVTAIKLLQRAMWSAFRPSEAKQVREDIFTYLKDDGVMGPITNGMLNLINSDALLATFKSEVASYYRILIERNNSLKKYEKGWLRRAYA